MFKLKKVENTLQTNIYIQALLYKYTKYVVQQKIKKYQK